GVCAKIGLGLSGVDVKAVKPVKAEEYLTGKAPNDATLDEAAALAAEAVNPNSDIHASAEYRREMARVYTRRALKATVEAAKGLK
ncbi:MAG: xanthine dehydrogenase family protein subunit M, partial [Candidatus Bathyarchaeia archaeon]